MSPRGHITFSPDINTSIIIIIIIIIHCNKPSKVSFCWVRRNEKMSVILFSV